MNTPDLPRILIRRIRLALGIFIAGLVVSGLTAIPLLAEIRVLRGLRVGQGFPGAETWLGRIEEALTLVSTQHPFLAYGTDWLAFGHLAIALAFVPACRDPARHRWLFDYGLALCALVIPWALFFGHWRGIPLEWRAIDAAFGLGGAIPLLLARHWTRQLVRVAEPPSG